MYECMRLSWKWSHNVELNCELEFSENLKVALSYLNREKINENKK